MIMVVLMSTIARYCSPLIVTANIGRGALVVEFRRQLGVRRDESRRQAVWLAFDGRRGEFELLAQAFAGDVDRRFLRVDRHVLRRRAVEDVHRHRAGRIIVHQLAVVLAELEDVAAVRTARHARAHVRGQLRLRAQLAAGEPQPTRASSQQ